MSGNWAKFIETPAVKRKILGVNYLIITGFFVGIAVMLNRYVTGPYGIEPLLDKFEFFILISFGINLVLNLACGLMLLFSSKSDDKSSMPLFWCMAALIATDLYWIIECLVLDNDYQLSLLVPVFHVYAYFMMDRIVEEETVVAVVEVEPEPFNLY